MTKQEKLASLATIQTAGDFHVEPFPKLAELAMGYGFKRGNEMFDEAMERWRVNFEKTVKQTLRANDVSSGDSG